MTTELNPLTPNDIALDSRDLDRVRIPPPPVSFEEYLDWLDEDTWADLVDGEVIVHSPAGDTHQDFVGFLHDLVRLHTERHNLGTVRLGPYVMRLAIRRAFEPDILFVRSDRSHLVRPYHLDGPADVAIEVVSPSRPQADTRDKRAWYQQGRVPEYWIINQVRQTQEFLELVDGVFRPIPVDPDGWFRSRMIAGFGFPVEWCRSWPSLDIALEQIRLSIPFERYEAERARAEAEHFRAERLARLLREHGINPDA